ncbi:hypothetical protein TSAR_006044, partial [Trichomalopsis sarcophagae]
NNDGLSIRTLVKGLRKLDNLVTFKAELQSVNKSAEQRVFFNMRSFRLASLEVCTASQIMLHQKKWKVMLVLILPNRKN